MQNQGPPATNAPAATAPNGGSAWKRLVLHTGGVLLYAVVLVGFGTLPIPWTSRLPVCMEVALHVVALLLTLGILYGFIRRWADNHTKTYTINDSNQLEDEAEFTPLKGAAAKADFERGYKLLARRFDLNKPSGLENLAAQLIKPRGFRRRIHERAEVLPGAISHDITINVPTAKLHKLSRENNYLVVVSRLEKQSQYEQLSVDDDSGSPSEMLNYRYVHAILYGMIRAYVKTHPLTPQDRTDLMIDVADLIVSSDPNPVEVGNIYKRVTKEESPTITSPPENGVLRGLLDIASKRRPVIVVVQRTEASELVLRVKYQDGWRYSAGVPEAIPGDWWRLWLDRRRAAANITPSQYFLQTDRARSASTYRLTFTSPPGTYIQETHAYAGSQRKWLRDDLNPHGYYNAFVGWTRPHGNSRASIACRLLSNTNVKDLRFYIRVCERPPGTLGYALIVAMAVSIVVWLAAFVTTNTGDSRNVDIVALALAFPGGLAIWLSMSTSADVGSFRSIRGRISMGASACISLMAILLYMVYPSAMYPRYVWHGGRLFFLLYDPLWSALLGLSVANFLLIVLSFAVALRRYRTLLKP